MAEDSFTLVMGQVNERFHSLSEHITQTGKDLSAKLDHVETKVDELSAKQSTMNGSVARNTEAIGRLEHKQNAHEEALRILASTVDGIGTQRMVEEAMEDGIRAGQEKERERWRRVLRWFSKDSIVQKLGIVTITLLVALEVLPGWLRAIARAF